MKGRRLVEQFEGNTRRFQRGRRPFNRERCGRSLTKSVKSKARPPFLLPSRYYLSREKKVSAYSSLRSRRRRYAPPGPTKSSGPVAGARPEAGNRGVGRNSRREEVYGHLAHGSRPERHGTTNLFCFSQARWVPATSAPRPWGVARSDTRSVPSVTCCTTRRTAEAGTGLVQGLARQWKTARRYAPDGCSTKRTDGTVCLF